MCANLLIVNKYGFNLEKVKDKLELNHYNTVMVSDEKDIPESQYNVILFTISAASLNRSFSAIKYIRNNFSAEIPIICMLEKYDESTILNLLNYGVNDLLKLSDSLPLIMARINLHIRLSTLIDKNISRLESGEITKHFDTSPYKIACFFYDDFSFLDRSILGGVEVMAFNEVPGNNIPNADIFLINAVSDKLLRCIDRLHNNSRHIPILVSNVETVYFNVLQRGFCDYINVRASQYELATRVRLQIEYKRLYECFLKTVKSNLQEINIDSLTGLYNKYYLSRYMDKIRKVRDFSICMIDLDNFKEINDTLGHIMADKILRELGKILQKHTRATDIVTKFGGDEFVIIFHNSNVKQTKKIMSRMSDIISRHFANLYHAISISYGIAEISECTSLEEVFSLADSRMYIDKGRKKSPYLISE